MAEYNAMDTAAFKGVWVFCEQREGQIQTISYQLLSEGPQAGQRPGRRAVRCGHGQQCSTPDYIKALGGYGADRVYNIDSPAAEGLHHRRLRQGAVRHHHGQKAGDRADRAPPTWAATWAPAAPPACTPA